MGSCRRHSGTGGGEQKQERRRQDKSPKTKKGTMCSKNPTMLVLCAILLVLPKAEAIKFSAEGVSVPDGVLRVDEPTELGCKYIMWRQESLASVTWSIKYSGVKTDFFVYKPFSELLKLDF